MSNWSLDARGNRYIGATEATIDYGMAFAKTARSEQSVDIYGNLTSSKAFHFGNLTTPRTHHVVTYLNSPAYSQRFILNRPTGTSVSYNGAAFVGLTAATYDNYAGNTLTPRTGLGLHDTANYGSSMLTRGNRTVGGVANGYNTLVAYDVSGFAVSGANGSTSTAATPDSKNAVATVLTPNSDPTKAMSMGFNSIYQVTSVQGPNGTSTSIGYDANARPTTTTGPHGAVTTFAYDDTNRFKTATTGTRWAKTYFDGFGRTIKEQTGTGSTIVSTVDTEYDSCGCSPLGKMKRVSRPYGPTDTRYWTTYNYDSTGRTINVVAPDGSTTAYIYEGNTTKVISTANKWKKHEVDVGGNLVKVTEPDPANPGSTTYETTYTYNEKGLLLTVTMQRPTGTQTRTFTYDANGKVLTATNPETGLVTNTYDSGTGLLLQKVDLKNNKVTYTYDSYKRVTAIERWEWIPPYGGTPGAYQPRTDQTALFIYDQNPYDSTAGQNLNGRLAVAITFANRTGANWNVLASGQMMTFREMYSYTTAGLVAKKRLVAIGKYSAAHAVASDTLESTYLYNPDGQLKDHQYPAAHQLLDEFETAGAHPTYEFDGMGRLNSMPNFVGSTVYNAAGQVTAINSINGAVNNELRSYNTLGQLTSLTSGLLRFEYDFAAGANDGRITTARTYSGASTTAMETVNYTYDALNRLSFANGGNWTAGYGYDGFGNLNSVTPTGTGPSAMNVAMNPTKNQVTGWNYDANGNVTAMPGGFTGTYDVENRLLEANKNGQVVYGYGADNRRIYESRRSVAAPDTIEEYVTLWEGSRRGNKYKIRWGPLTAGPPDFFVFARAQDDNLFFGAKVLRVNNTMNVSMDRLGSVRTGKDYFPYGQESPAAAPIPADKDKYATYLHDGPTDLSYADQRYYATGAGRFMTADPYKASAGAEDPGSWNRYAYVQGDPANFNDGSGLNMAFCVDGVCSSSGGGGGGGGGGGSGGGYWADSIAGAEGIVTRGINGEVGAYGIVQFFQQPGPRGGGGGGRERPAPECDTRDETNNRIISYIRDNQAAAQTLAGETGLDGNFLLAWGAYESGYGTSLAARVNNNYYGLTTPNWPGADACPRGAARGFACFDVPARASNSLLESGRSALSAANGRYLNPALAAQAAGGTVGQIATAIADAGFNSEFAQGVYGGRIQGVNNAIQQRVHCLNRP